MNIPDEAHAARIRIKRAYEEFLQCPFAADIMEDLAIRCGVHTSTFYRDDPYGRLSAHEEGKRFTYLYIKRMGTPMPDDIPMKDPQHD